MDFAPNLDVSVSQIHKPTPDRSMQYLLARCSLDPVQSFTQFRYGVLKLKRPRVILPHIEQHSDSHRYVQSIIILIIFIRR